MPARGVDLKTLDRAVRAVSLLLALFAGQAAAQTWSGGFGSDDNWSTGANWAGGVAPASSSTTQVDFPLGLSGMSFVDVPWTVNRMTVAGPYRLGGQAITFSGANPTLLIPISGSFPTVIANPIVVTSMLVIGNGSFLDLTGGISGAGSVTFGGGPGFTMLVGNSTFTGGATVSGVHVLLLAGGSMPGPVTVQSASGLSGGGSIAGAVSVIDSNSWVYPTPSHGVLRTGNFTDAGFLNIDINGTSQGTQYSHLDVAGTVTLAASSGLRLAGSFVPPEGTVFTILTNDGTDPVTGTFASLPEGATVTFNGVRLRISYVGGTGNDVTLSAVGPPVASAQVPTLSNLALLLLAIFLSLMGATRLRR